MKTKILIFLILITSFLTYGNLPPTSSRISGDATGVTTFNFEFPNFTGTHNGSTVTLGTLSIAGGGTGSASQNFVDLTTAQSIAGVKTFSDNIAGNITGNAATVTTNANLTGDVTSIGNTTTYSGIVPINKGGTGSATQNFVDLTTNQTIAGEKTFSNDMIVATDITLSAAQFNNVKLGNMASRLVSTGVAGGAVLAIDTDTTKFDLAIQYLSFSNYVTTAQDPIVKEVECPALDAQSVTNLAVADITYILVDDACAVTQQTTYPTAQEQRLKAFIGRLNHTSRTAIDSIFSTPTFIVAPLSQYNDLLDSLGPFNVNGNVVSANGANLSINRASGTLFRRGLNYATDDQNPHEKFYAAATAGSFFRSTQTAVGTSTFTTLSVSNYDLAGTVTAMPGGGGTATNQRVFLLASGNMAVQYGQVIYSSLANAVSGLPNEAFVINPTLADAGVLIGVISCRKDATAANNTAQCVFSKVSRFDSSGVSVGSNSVATLQSAYDNSVTPQITTSTTLGSLDIIRGSASDTDNVLRIQNGSASDVIKAAGTGRLDTRFSSPTNLLNNGDSEFTDITPFTCTVGTCTRTTTSGEYSQGNAALKVALSAQAMNVSQTVTTPSGIQKQGFARVIYRVPSTMADFQVCTLVDAAEQTCAGSEKLVLDDTFRSIEIPLTFGSTSAGIKFKTTSSYSANAYFDGAILSQGLGLQNLQTDNVYSAQVVTTTGVVTSENKDFIASCTAANPTVCTFTSGIFSVAPTCTTSNASVQAAFVTIQSTSATTITVTSNITTNGAAAANVEFKLICQKSGNDYLASSANVYSQASANTDWAACTFSTLAWQGLGTVTNNSLQCRRSNGMLGMRGKITVGTVTASTIQIPLPTNFGTITSASTIGTNEISGMMYRITATANTLTTAILQPSVSYFNVAVSGLASTTASANTPGAGSSTFGTGETFEFAQIEIPISGWANSSAIVGSFAELGIKLQTSTATTSGTSVDYTIPVGVKRVTVMYKGVSTNSSSNLLVQIGSGSLTTSGYASGASRGSAVSTSSTTGFIATADNGAGVVYEGGLVLNSFGSNSWISTGNLTRSNDGINNTSGGSITLSGAIDRVRITTVNGTDLFDLGSVNVSWEY